MEDFEFTTDRTVDSTGNNEYAEGMRDENLWDDDLIDTDVSIDDRVPDAVGETNASDRPLYDEQDYRHNAL